MSVCSTCWDFFAAWSAPKLSTHLCHVCAPKSKFSYTAHLFRNLHRAWGLSFQLLTWAFKAQPVSKAPLPLLLFWFPCSDEPDRSENLKVGRILKDQLIQSPLCNVCCFSLFPHSVPSFAHRVSSSWNSPQPDLPVSTLPIHQSLTQGNIFMKPALGTTFVGREPGFSQDLL